MTADLLIDRARYAWAGLTQAPVTFPAEGVTVVVSAGSQICPPGWSGVVAVGGAAIATVPVADLAHDLSSALAGVPIEDVTEAALLQAALPVTDILGPASLAYLDDADFRPVANPGVEAIPADHDDLAAFLTSVDPEDAAESGLSDITSPGFALRSPSGLVAVAGYRLWPDSVAHVSVLTAPGQRGLGLARAVASAAVADALEHRLLPQWRSRPEPSRRVARALGFRRLGAQLSLHIDH